MLLYLLLNYNKRILRVLLITYVQNLPLLRGLMYVIPFLFLSIFYFYWNLLDKWTYHNLVLQ